MDYQTFQTVGNIGEKNILNMIKNYILYYQDKYEIIDNKRLYNRVFSIFKTKFIMENKENLKRIKKNEKN